MHWPGTGGVPQRTSRTRKGPIEGVWCDVLGWCSGRRRSGVAGPTARDGTGSFQPSAPAYVEAEGTAAARYHDRQAGLRRVRSNAAGSRWNTGNGSAARCTPSTDFSVTFLNEATGRRDQLSLISRQGLNTSSHDHQVFSCRCWLSDP